MGSGIRKEMERIVDSVLAELKELERTGDFEEFLDGVLDIRRTQVLLTDGWETAEYTLTLGAGGPSVYLTVTPSGWATVKVYWWTEKAERREKLGVVKLSIVS